MRRMWIALIFLLAAATAGFVSRQGSPPVPPPKPNQLKHFLEHTPPLGSNVHENNCTTATPAFGFGSTLAPNAHAFDCIQDGPYTATTGGGWYRQQIRGLHMPDCSPHNITGPCDMTVVRVCHVGGADQTSPCKLKNNSLTGGKGCAICVAATFTPHPTTGSTHRAPPPAVATKSATTS